jgi:hypothetical protein
MRHTLFDRLRVSARVGAYHPVGEEPVMDTPEQDPVDIDDRVWWARGETQLGAETRPQAGYADVHSCTHLHPKLCSPFHFILDLRSHLRSQVDRNNAS